MPFVDNKWIARVGFLTSLAGVILLLAIGPFGKLISSLPMYIAVVSTAGLITSDYEVLGLTSDGRHFFWNSCFLHDMGCC